MFKENKILFENIKKFRFLLTENVNENDMSDYIQNHEYVYIYYAGDGENKKGYRTIRPYVLGISDAGNVVVRAWQDNKKNSYTFEKRPTRSDSLKHDYWVENGETKPGWRLFRLDKIVKAYPTGKKFHRSDGSVMIPPDYNEGGDKGMTSIIAYISTSKEPETVSKEIIPQTTTAPKKSKWSDFTHGDARNRKITPNDVIKLRDIASRVYKKSRGSYLVAINNNNDFELIDVKNINKVPESAIVGTLTNLYDTLVRPNAPADNRFFNSEKNKLKNLMK